MRVTVPASSANLGPGFDCLGLALELPLHLDVGEAHSEHSQLLDEHHLANRAFRNAGGVGPLFAETSIAPGKGLGFSGAARVGGLAAASLQQSGSIHYPALFNRAAELEGHGDNVAASIYGGLAVTAGGRVVRLPPPAGVVVVVWIPATATSTTKARTQLPETVGFGDAVHNIGNTALLVAGLAAGDLSVLATASEDRLHQPTRLAAAPSSQRALDAAFHAGAAAAWLSGSGPTVAALVPAGGAAAVAEQLPDDGHTKVLPIARFGVRVN